jgi:hypothetical protein
VETRASLFLFLEYGKERSDMFEKLKKKLTNSATVTAVENAKETLNDKLETYSGIIKVGLTIAVLGFGAKKIHDHSGKGQQQTGMQPQQAPVIINNYFGTEGRQTYGNQAGQAGKNQRKH